VVHTNVLLHTLTIFWGFQILTIGILVTIFLILQTRGEDQKPFTLETLTAKHGHPKIKLDQIWKRRANEVIRINELRDEENTGGDPITTEQERVVFEQQDSSSELEMEEIARRLDVRPLVDRTA